MYKKRKNAASQKFWNQSNSQANGLSPVENWNNSQTSQRPRTAMSDLRSIHHPEEREEERQAIEKGIQANRQTKQFKFLSTVGGGGYQNSETRAKSKLKTENYPLKSREAISNDPARPTSAISSVHIDRAIDSKLYQFGANSASTYEIEQKIKAQNYIKSLQRGSEVDLRKRLNEQLKPKYRKEGQDRPYTASTLLNDKPQFRITTPNPMSAHNKRSLGDLLSEEHYKNELKQLEVVEDASEDINEFVSAGTEMMKKQNNRASAVALRRPMTSAIQKSSLSRPISTFSFKRPISSHKPLQSEKLFTSYGKEEINIGDDIPYEELFDRNERTVCATFARFGDLGYHSPQGRIGLYMQFPAKFKRAHLEAIVALQNTVTTVEKSEFEIPIQLGILDELLDTRYRSTPGVSSVFKKEEIEREPVTVCLFPEYFEDQDETYEEEREPNKEAAKYLKAHLDKMGGSYDPEKIIKDEFYYVDVRQLPSDTQNQIKISYRRLKKFLEDDVFIKNEEIARFRREWISNAIRRVSENLFREHEHLVRNLFQEIFSNYRQAVRESVLKYLLLSSEERKRLSIPLLVRESPSSVERIARAGAYSLLLYPDWHEFVENGRDFLQQQLFNSNIVISSLVNWKQDFEGILPLETEIIKRMAILGKSMTPMAFSKIQRNYRERVRSFMYHVWLKGAIMILKKFKYIRLHRERKGHWDLLGFFLKNLNLKDYLDASIEKVSLNKAEADESAEAIFNVISTRIQNAIVKETRQAEIPFDRWGDINIDELLDIRDCSAYRYYATQNKEPILLEENGYKLLSFEVRTRLRASVGVLLGIQLREKVDATLGELDKLIMTLPLFSELLERLEKDDVEQAEYASLIQTGRVDYSEITEAKSPMPGNKTDKSLKSSTNLQTQEDTRGFKERFGRVLGPDLEFNEIKKAVDSFDVLFLNFKFLNPRFLRYQRECRPFLQMDLILENDSLKFDESEDTIRALFTKIYIDTVDIFKMFPHPEYITIEVKEDPLESHPKDCFPTDTNYEAFYKRFMPHLELKEKKRKKKVQSILESAQVEDPDEKSQTLTINDQGEQVYVEGCRRLIERVLKHYSECREVFVLFNQFRLVQDKTVERAVRSFASKNHIALEDFRRNYLIVKAFKDLLTSIPDSVYLPLFEIKTKRVKDHYLGQLIELEKILVDKVRNQIGEELISIKNRYQEVKDRLQKPIENATQYKEMQEVVQGLTQDKIQLRNRSNEVYKRLFFLSRLFVADTELFGRTKEIFDWPSLLETQINNALLKHQDYKAKLVKDLETMIEDFKTNIEMTTEELSNLQAMTSFDNYATNVSNIRKINDQLNEIEGMEKEIIDQQGKLFGKVQEFKQVGELRSAWKPISYLWENVSKFMDLKNDMYNRRVFEIEMPEIDQSIIDGEKALRDLRTLFAKSKEELKIADMLEKRISELKLEYPSIAIVSTKGLSDRHWYQIKQILNNAAFDFKTDKLSDILENAELSLHTEELSKIANQAASEHRLGLVLSKIQTEWSTRKIELTTWKNSDTFIFAGIPLEETQQQLDDHILKVQAVRADPSVKILEAQAEEWENILAFLQSALEIWIKVQSSLLYLLPVFSSEDIRAHLPKAAIEFKKAHASWEDLMRVVSMSPTAPSIKCIPNLMTKLREMESQLSAVEKELTEYLNIKRTKFSRFYFLSNEELLSILGDTKDPNRVQPHLRQCFEGIRQLIFNLEGEVSGMKGELGEEIMFETKVIPKHYKAAVEEWLGKVEEQMRITLRTRIEEALLDLGHYKTNRGPWLKKWPGQAILACSEVSWTLLVEDRIKLIKQMKELKDECTSMLEDAVRFVRGDLSPQLRSTISALITVEVHHLDVLTQLINERVSSSSDFYWQCRLRMYPSTESGLSLEMVGTKLEYGYEYLGNAPRLVVTPLTDRCRRTLMSAMSHFLGGAPEGPAGTGKTETVKDLSRAAGVQCIVLNCSKELNAGSMARVFKGMISAGAWSCFDEFNRIQVEVLSVVAQQIQQIQAAKAARVKEFRFEGTNIKLRDACNVFITMNPGYAGRTELPDNLKALFRPVAMMVPDFSTIAEISLYACGFVEAKALSFKLVAAHRLASEQLSTQKHYDHGMRAVKAGLLSAARLKRLNPDQPEDEIILQGLKESTIPRLMIQDLEIFKAILMDLFPTVEEKDQGDPIFEETFSKIMKKENLSDTNLRSKASELKAMLDVRQGIVLLGDPLTGKSVCMKILSAAIPLCTPRETSIAISRINHKSVTIEQLYGRSDPISQEWTEGILSHAFKKASKRSFEGSREWLHFDGPIDADWIENLNSVLDDSKVLCLSSGDKVPLGPKMSLLFETDSLAKASPATVSRCGVVYFPTTSIGSKAIFNSWITSTASNYLEIDNIEHLVDLYDIVFCSCSKYIEGSQKQYQPLGETYTCIQFLKLFDILMKEAGFYGGNISEDQTLVKNQLSILFVHCLALCIGLSLFAQFRKDFDKFVRRLVGDSVKSESRPDRIIKFERDVVPPETAGAMMIDYHLDLDQWTWIPSREMLYDADSRGLEIFDSFSDICIETEETLRLRRLQNWFISIRLSLIHELPLLIAGPTGVGKSKLITDEVMALPADSWQNIRLSFGPRTSEVEVKEDLMNLVERKKRGVYGPRGVGRRGIWFIDDINLPTPEVGGAQPPLEVIRMYLEHKGWKDPTDLKDVSFIDFSFIACHAPPGGTRPPLPPRLLRHFMSLIAPEYSSASLLRIYNKIVSWISMKKTLPEEPQRILGFAVETSIELYSQLSDVLKPTPAKPHYIFTLRDLGRVFRGIYGASAKELAQSHNKIGRLWLHEIWRVYADRLTGQKDKDSFYYKLKNCINQKFRTTIETLLKTADSQETGVVALESIIFTDVLGEAAEPSERPYVEQMNFEHVRKKLEFEADELALTKKERPIVLFDQAVMQLLKISRVFRLEGSHCGLLGLGGSGRQTLATLAAHVMGQQTQTTKVHKGYSEADWRAELRKILVDASLGNRPVTLHINETQIDLDLIVRDLDSLLSIGEAPPIFSNDDFLPYLDKTKDRIRRDGEDKLAVNGSLQDFISYFLKRAKDNLHLVFIINSLPTTLRKLVRSWPNIFTCSTLINFEAWPESALEKVAIREVSDLLLEGFVERKVCRVSVFIHLSSQSLAASVLKEEKRFVFVPPAFILDLLVQFKRIYSKMKSQSEAQSKLLTLGVDKIIETQTFIEEMGIILAEKGPQLKEAEEKRAKFQKELEGIEAEVLPIYERVMAEEEIVSEECRKAEELKMECDAELKVVAAVLDEAKEAVKTITVGDLFIVKSYPNPPAEVRLVMAAICILLNKKPDTDKNGNVNYWPTSKTLLGEGTKLLAKLNNYGEKDLNVKTMAKVRAEYISNPKFKPEFIVNISKPASAFCRWVLAADKMEEALRAVLPKREKSKQAEDIASKMRNELEVKQKELKVYQDKIDDLRNQLEEGEKKRRSLEEEIRITKERFDRAKILVEALGTERISWEERLEVMRQKVPLFIGNSLLSAAVMTYLGPFVGMPRQKEIVNWLSYAESQNLEFMEKFNLEETIGNSMELRKWVLSGLPSDQVSREKAILVYKSTKVPLLVDPQGQATTWIKSVEKDRNLRVTKLDRPDFARTLEEAVTLGYPLLIDSLPEDIEPSLYSLLSINNSRESITRDTLALGESKLEVHANFRLFTCTKLSKPVFAGKIYSLVTIINFSVSKEGLEDQLLELAVTKERPDLEDSRIRLVEQGHTNSKRLAEVEEEILDTLQNTSGNILDNEAAVQTLKRSNQLGLAVKERQAVAVQNQQLNDEARKVYRKLASHASILFGACQNLSKVRSVYEFSLNWYTKIFTRATELAEKSSFVEQRLESISDKLDELVFSNVCRGLYEKDKLLFALILASTRTQGDFRTPDPYLIHLITPPSISEFKDHKSQIEWISDIQWQRIKASENISSKFEGLSDNILANPGAWEVFYTHSTPESAELPQPFEEATDQQRLILLKLLRPERLMHGLRKYVLTVLGKRYLQPPAFNIEASYSESKPSLPLIFLLPGVTPELALESFCKRIGMDDLRRISLGQGQSAIAEKAIEDCKVNGGWVLLENCHLYPSWMVKLATICEELSDPAVESKLHPQFRLWMTTYPTASFPNTILQSSIKMANEPPSGLSTNLELSYMTPPLTNPDFLENHPNPSQFKTLIFSLCIFHASVLERRNFGPLGWNIPYGFSLEDLRVSVLTLAELTKGNPNMLPYKAMQNLIGDCHYGGRVTDHHDRRLLHVLLADCLTPKIFYDGYRYAELEDYEIPEVGTRKDYLNFINKLPLEQPPELYGLHRNALIAKSAGDVEELSQKIDLVWARNQVGGNSSSSVEDEDKLMAPLIELKNQIPPKFAEKMVATKFYIDYDQSLNAVLQQEVSRYNRLLDRINSNIEQLIQALKGEVLLSFELEESLELISQKRVPKVWLEVSYSSLKPLGSYIDDLRKRIEFFKSWIDNGTPTLFWISGIFFTQSFLTGVLQNYARKYKIPIDELNFNFELGKLYNKDTAEEYEDRSNTSADRCPIYGLFFEGCGWDPLEKRLIECKGREVNTPAPIIVLLPTKDKKQAGNSEYSCPVYKTAARRGELLTTGHSTNFVMSIDVYTDYQPKAWVRRGTALLCQLSE